jgi:LysM repeat protein
MHRDKKVGLALAILLCSVVGAFFFRDDAPRSNGPELKDSDRIDREIALDNRGGRRSPYNESGARASANDASRSERSRPGFDPKDLPDFLRDDSVLGDSSTQRHRANSSRNPLLDGPSRLTPLPDEVSTGPAPLHNSEWEIAANDPPATRRSTTNAAPAVVSQERMHVVTDGETLSSIAGKYLGSQARYHEIFNANRDQLKSPNDLKIGMKLKIPQRSDTRSVSTPRTETSSDKTTTVKTPRPTPPAPARSSTAGSSESTAPAVKFKPAKASPSIRRTTDASNEVAPGQSLSQFVPGSVTPVDDGILAELERDMELQVAQKEEDLFFKEFENADRADTATNQTVR